VSLTEPLTQLADAARSARRSARGWAGFALVAGTAVASLLVARQGTLATRLAAALAIGAGTLVAVAWEPLLAQRLRDSRRFLRGPVARVDAEAAQRALRALSLVAADGDVVADGTSPELARLQSRARSSGSLRAKSWRGRRRWRSDFESPR
jgi:hypothetical protein